MAGFDDLGDTLQGIRDGSIVFCVVQNTYRMGWLSVERLLDAVAGRVVPRVIDTGVVFVDRKNIDTYRKMMEADNTGSCRRHGNPWICATGPVGAFEQFSSL